jgi:hypothetical protein
MRPASVSAQVRVKILERREKDGKVSFLVHEDAMEKNGILGYGNPPLPDKLPQIGDEIDVYRNNNDPRSPQYRWDPPPAPSAHQERRPGGRGGPPRRR